MFLLRIGYKLVCRITNAYRDNKKVVFNSVDFSPYIEKLIAFFNLINTPLGLLFIVTLFGFLRSRFLIRQALSKNIFPGTQATLSETLYQPTGEINPATGGEFFDQKIRTVNHAIDIGLIFHPSMREQVMGYLRKAAQKCEGEDIVVFQKLYASKAFTKKGMQTTRERISRRWKNYFGELLNTSHIEVRSRAPREKFIGQNVFLIMVNEKLSRTQQIRIFIIPGNWLSSNSIPPFADVRFENPDGSFSHDEHHAESIRWRSNQKIVEALKEDKRLFEDCRVEFYTGESLYVEPPKIRQ